MLLSFSAKESNQRKLPATLMFCESQWTGFTCASRTPLMPDFWGYVGFVGLVFSAKELTKET